MAAKECFGYTYPNYEVETLSQLVCFRKNFILKKINFYTGVPPIRENRFWSKFWENKLASMGQKGITVFKRELRYRNEKVACPHGDEFIYQGQEVKCPHDGEFNFRVAKEKGVDIRIAIDVLRSVLNKESDAILIFSQDQDLSEVVSEIKKIAASQERKIEIVSAFPVASHSSNNRGVNGTDWFRINKVDYDSCLDSRDYRENR